MDNETARKSPSPRKAWIETILLCDDCRILVVAFPPEGVD